jgi:LytS/YehU family sensor histidine kinase
MRYLAATLPQMRSPIGTLGEEIELARAYLELFALRMGERLSFSIALPAELAPLPFPRMVVLTLVENAIKHGLAPADDGGSITVSAGVADGKLLVSVADDGVGFGQADTGGTGIGLANIRARLLTQYGRAARLELGEGAAGGVEAIVRLPLSRGEPSGRDSSPARFTRSNETGALSASAPGVSAWTVAA